MNRIQALLPLPLLLGIAATLCAGADRFPSVSVTPTSAPGAGGTNAPSVIYVTDFYLSPEMIQPAKTVPERVGLGRGPLANLRRELDTVRGDDPAAKAGKLVTALSQSITDALKKAGYRAEYKPGAPGLRQDFFPEDVSLPATGWLVGGWFEKVQENNRAEEAAVGFGAGSGQVSVEVAVSDLSANPRDPFLRIGSESGTKRMPGGLVARNPYAVAAKFVLSRGEDEKDVKAMGSAIASQLVKYMQKSPAKETQP